MQPNKTTFINRFQIIEYSFKLSLNMDLKLQYANMKKDMLNLFNILKKRSGRREN